MANNRFKTFIENIGQGNKKSKDSLTTRRIRIKGNPSSQDHVPIARKGRTLPDFLESIEGSSLVDVSELNQFRTMSSDREIQYKIYDEMARDTIISSALELYSDDATQYNSKGQIVWAEAEDPDISAFANRLIEILDLNNNAWSHIYTMVKYGDLYLETYRDDETDEQSILTGDLSYSDVKVHREREGSQMEEYIEAVSNPSDIFDLTSRGKTVGFIRVPTDDRDSLEPHASYQYLGDEEETVVLRPTKYIHVAMSNDVDRFPQTLKLRYVKDGTTDLDEQYTRSYVVSRGKSVLHNIYKSYKELSLMEDSLLLNRVTRSSIIRLLQIEVGDMPKGKIRELLKRFKSLIEQKNYMDKNDGTYTSMAAPGPIDNVIYVPTKDGKGAISASNLGGDVDIKSIVDIDYFKNKVYGGLKIPSAFLEGKCLHQSVVPVLLDGSTNNIKSMYEDKDAFIGRDIVTCSISGSVTSSKIVDVQRTRINANFVRVNLDNEKSFIVTPDHPVMLDNGIFLEAIYLSEGLKLMPYSTTVIDNDLITLDNETGTYLDLKTGSTIPYIVTLNEVSTAVMVTSVDVLDIIEDAYDLTVESDNHTFAIDSGLFIHNSDDGGLSAGTALTKLDSRYARTIKRIQNSYIMGITTLVNLFALDRGLDDHVNNFVIKMVSPSTIEDSERDEVMDSRMNMIGTFMDLIADENIVDNTTRKDILMYFVSNFLNEPEIAKFLAEDTTTEIQEEIPEEGSEEDGFSPSGGSFSSSGSSPPSSSGIDGPAETGDGSEGGDIPDNLGADDNGITDNTEFGNFEDEFDR